MRFFEPEINKWIRKMFKHSFKKKWYKTYWAFDFHGVIIKPHVKDGTFEVEFYPYAKELLQLLSKRDDIILFTFSSSYPEEMEVYKRVFEENDIKFDYFNENPEISSENGAFGYYKTKPYYNVLFEDKGGFEPTQLKKVYNMMIKFNRNNYLPNKNWK